MVDNGDFKVIIVGGGVGGLSLASMLEKFGLDYVILEAHGDITPAVGASIGMLPNGLRILDQVGVYDTIMARAVQPITSAHTRNVKGKSLFSIQKVTEYFVKHYGYAVTFFDRQWLLEILYSHLEKKDRVILNKRVTQIDQTGDGVRVTTADGTVTSGTLVVGADGVNSIVRELMVRVGNKLQPGYFSPGEVDRIPCYYRCFFGISKDIADYDDGQLNTVHADGWSSLIASGPGSRVYWFIFQRLPEVKYGKEIPKYTREDESRLVSEARKVDPRSILYDVKECWDYAMTEKITFGQLYSKKLFSTLTPLHELVLEKWFFGRVTLLGDSVHKPNPITGQGGNGAIESAAELVNAIVRMRNSRSDGLKNLAGNDIETIFRQAQSARHERAKDIVADAHWQQAISACENPLLSAFVRNFIGPFSGDDFALSFLSKPVFGSARLEQLPMPSRSRLEPFADELPAKPKTGYMVYVVQGGFAATMTSLLWLAGKALRLPEDLGQWNDAGAVVLSRPWTSLGGGVLAKLVSFFSYVLEGSDVAPRVHTVYFLSQLASHVLLTTIDGYRKGNKGTLLSVPSLLLGVMQIKGVAFLAPFQEIIRAVQGAVLPASRFVAPDVGEALLPAMTLGYTIPTALMLAPGLSAPTRQGLTALWQFSPVLVPAFTALFSTGLRCWRRLRQTSNSKECDNSTRGTVKHHRSLETAYSHAIAVQAACHIATLSYAYLSPNISIANMLFGVPSPLNATWNLPNTASKVATFLKYDFGIACGAWAAGNLYSVWNLRRLGHIQTGEAIKVAAAIIIGQVVIGPGATSTSFGLWREKVLSDIGRD